MYKRQFITDLDKVEKIWEESIEKQPQQFWESCGVTVSTLTSMNYPTMSARH